MYNPVKMKPCGGLGGSLLIAHGGNLLTVTPLTTRQLFTEKTERRF